MSLRGCIWNLGTPNATGEPVFIFYYDLDAGTWTRLSFPTDTPLQDYFAGGWVFYGSDKTYLVTMKYGSSQYQFLYSSVDEGANWTAETYPGTALIGTNGNGWTAFSTRTGRLWAWGYISGNRMLSYFDGTAWTVSDSENSAIGGGVSVNVSPVVGRLIASPTNASKVWILQSDSELYYNGNDGTLADWVTYDPRVLFENVIASMHDDTVLYGVDGADVYKITGNGATVTPLTSATGLDIKTIAESPTNSQVLFIGGNASGGVCPIQYSLDGGTTWNDALSATYDAEDVYQIECPYEGSGAVIARGRVGNARGIFVCTDGTYATWTWKPIIPTNIESGTTTSVALKTLTDATKSWTTDEWKNYGVVDSAGTVFEIKANDATSLTLGSGTPAAGAYYLSYYGGNLGDSQAAHYGLYAYHPLAAGTFFFAIPDVGIPPEPPVIPPEPIDPEPDPPDPPDPVFTPVERPDGTDTCLVYDEGKNGWMVYDAIPAEAVVWNPDRRHIVLCGNAVTDDGDDVKALGGMFRYGQDIGGQLIFSFHGLNDVFKYKRVRHVEIQTKADAKEIGVYWEFEGNEVGGRATEVYTAKGECFGASVSTDNVAYFSSDGSGGHFTRPLERKYRYVCPQGGMGMLARLRIETEGEGEVTIERVAINFVMAP